MYKTKRRIGVVLIELLLLAYLVSLVYPFIWIFFNSFKSTQEFFQNVWDFPPVVRFSNYVRAWNESNIGRYFMNSVFITAAGVCLQVFFASSAGYVLSKYTFPGRKIVYSMAIVGFLIPSVGTLSPFYILMKSMNLFNLTGVLIYYAGGIGANMLIMYSVFKGIAWDYAEAAFIDGAGHSRVFFSVMLPLAKGGMVTVGMFSAIGLWNDYFIPSLLLNNEQQYTIAVGLNKLYYQQSYQASWTILFAGMIISIIPILIAYACFSEKITEGVAMGGLKG